jgi:hypothetical protein
MISGGNKEIVVVVHIALTEMLVATESNVQLHKGEFNE